MSAANGVNGAKPLSRQERAERAVLGACLRQGDVVAEVAQVLRPDDFRSSPHRTIFSAMLRLWDAGKPVDMQTVADMVNRDMQPPEIPYHVFAELWDEVPTAANAVYYAQQVREDATVRQLQFAGDTVSRNARDGIGNAQQQLEEAEKLIFAIAEMGVEGSAITLDTAVQDSFERLDARQNPGNAQGIVTTGFLDLDRLLGGLHPSELTIIGARPSIGKTALGLALLMHCVRDLETPAFIASLEMSRIELAERLICMAGGIDSYRLRRGLLSREEAARVAEVGNGLRRLPLHIDDGASQTMLRVAANARRLKRRHGIGLVVVDYLQLVDPEDRRAQRYEQVGAVSRRLKCLAKELKVPVVAMAQLNRSCEDRPGGKPRLADIRECGGVEQDADTVMLLHRPENPEGQEVVAIEVLVAKQRNGPIGERTLAYRKPFMRFENYALDGWRASE